MKIISTLLAVIPALLLLWFFYKRDLFPEPPKVLWITFALGILSVIPILFIERPLSLFVKVNLHGNPFLFCAAYAFIVAGMVEEGFKFLVLRFYSFRHKEFDEPMDRIVYGVAASLGFATLENLSYVSWGGMSTALLRSITSVPGHAFMGAVMGYYLGLSRFPKKNLRLLFFALLIPIILHGLYDFPLFYMRFQTTISGVFICAGVFLITLIFECILALVFCSKLSKQQKLEKSLKGTIINKDLSRIRVGSFLWKP